MKETSQRSLTPLLLMGGAVISTVFQFWNFGFIQKRLKLILLKSYFNTKIQYDTVRYSTICYDTISYDTVGYCAVYYNTVQNGMIATVR